MTTHFDSQPTSQPAISRRKCVLLRRAGCKAAWQLLTHRRHFLVLDIWLLVRLVRSVNGEVREVVFLPEEAATRGLKALTQGLQRPSLHRFLQRLDLLAVPVVRVLVPSEAKRSK